MAILNTKEGAVAHMHDLAIAAVAADKGGEPSDVKVKLGQHEFTIDEVEIRASNPTPANEYKP